MAVDIKVVKPPTAYFKDGIIGGKITLDAAFYVKGELAIVLTFVDMAISNKITLKDFVLYNEIQDISFADIEQRESKIGEQDTFSMVSMLNMGAGIAVPIIN